MVRVNGAARPGTGLPARQAAETRPGPVEGAFPTAGDAPEDRQHGGAEVSRRTTPGAPACPDAAARPPVPFGQFIVKVHGRCNLACRYCYLYEGPDRTWRGRPAAAAPAVLDRTADRIAEHAATHALRSVALVLHGGEPLLVGAGRLGAFSDRVRERIPGGCTLHATVQTNATLLTDARVATLARHGVRVGISLDGGLARHNTLRTDHAGRPSWPAASRGARLLADRHPDAYAGILTVVDPRTDPVEMYESLLALRPPALDLLLPHGNWTTPPPGIPDRGHRAPDRDRRARPRTATGCAPSSTAGGRPAGGRPGSGSSRSASPCCSACPPPPNRWASTRSTPSSSRPTARSNRSTP